MHCHWPWPEGHFRMVELDGTVATAANKAVEERLVLLMEEELHPLRKKPLARTPTRGSANPPCGIASA